MNPLPSPAASTAHTAPTQFIEVGDIRYAYRRFGRSEGTPLVCFQHFTGTLDNWDPLILDGLAARREVIIFDNAGVGGSSGATPERVAPMMQDALAFLDALALRQVDVLGFSLGGFLAQELALHRPQLVRKLIIVGSAAPGAEVLKQFPDLIGRAMTLPPAERFLFIFFAPSEASRTKGKAALLRQLARSQDRDPDATPQAVQAQLRAITAWGAEPPALELKAIRQPTLIVQGSDDQMMASENSYALFKQLPNARLSLYPDSAHGSFLQYPELFVHEANYFLDEPA